MFERFFRSHDEDSSSEEQKAHDRESKPFSARRLRYESGHAVPAPMFLRLKEDPPQGE